VPQQREQSAWETYREISQKKVDTRGTGFFRRTESLGWTFIASSVRWLNICWTLRTLCSNTYQADPRGSVSSQAVAGAPATGHSGCKRGSENLGIVYVTKNASIAIWRLMFLGSARSICSIRSTH
jgi:hypothetical protein